MSQQNRKAEAQLMRQARWVIVTTVLGVSGFVIWVVSAFK